MKNHILKSAVIVFTFLSLVSCNMDNRFSGSDDLVTISRDLATFENIKAGDALVVNVTQGPVQEVLITVNSNLTDNLLTEVVDNTLNISLKNGNYKRSTFILDIQVPSLNRLEFNDAVEGEVFMTSETLHLDIRDASNLILKGKSETLNLDLSDASDLKGYEFLTEVLNVRLTDASNLEITVTEEMNGKIKGASSIKYKGNPILNVSTQDASKLINRN